MGGDVGPRPGAQDSSFKLGFWSLRCNALPFLPWCSLPTVWLPLLIGIVAHGIRTSKRGRPFVRLVLPGARAFFERFCLLAFLCLCLFISICSFVGASGTLDMCLVPGGTFAYVHCAATTVAGTTAGASASTIWFLLTQPFVYVGSLCGYILTIPFSITWGPKIGQILTNCAYFGLLSIVSCYRDTIRAGFVRTVVLNRLTMYVLHHTLVWEIRSLRMTPQEKIGNFVDYSRCHVCTEQGTPVQACVAKRVVGRCSILLYRLTTPASALLITLVLMLANLPMIRAVCTICGGFFAGCTGGADGQTCEGTAAVKKNAAALVATSTTALSLAGMFGPKVTRVFNTTVLGLIKTYATLPVAGTPYVCDDHTPVENIEAVSAGKVTKSEVQIHFSRLIATYATLPDAEAHTKIKIIEAQISLL